MSSATEIVPSPIPSPFALKTIVWATDFSDSSEKTGRYAAAMARQFDAELLVAHAFVLTQAAMEVEAEEPDGKWSIERAEFEAALKQDMQRVGAGLRSSRTMLLEGDAEEQIPRLAQQYEPSLIVLGTEGGSTVARAVMGSTAEKILRSTGGPAITVGPHVPMPDSAGPVIRRVLYATSLADGAARGAAYAVGMAQAFHAKVELLHVVRPEDMNEPEALATAQRRFEASLATMVPDQAGQIAAPHPIVETGDAHERILEHVREDGIDLLVLTLHRGSHLWLESRFSGAFSIIAKATCPVLTVVR